MERNPKTVAPLTPDYFDPKRQQPVDVSKYLPWMRGFKQYQPPADQKIEERKESK